jgi:hypothetical protein
MKFLMTFAADPKAPPPTPEKLAALGKLTQDMIAAGVVIMTGGLVRPSKGTHVRCEGGKITLTDGPFAETKELIDGFALIHAKSKEEAIEHASTFMKIAGDGVGEILQVFDAAEIPH